VERHVDLLGILASLWGALAVLVGVALLLLAAGAIVPMFDPAGGAVQFAAGLTAGVFTILGLFALLWGSAHIWASMLLRQRQPLGRMLTLALALVDLLVLPFGTALGVYAFWVLLTNDGRRLFEPHPTTAA
jgi:membrane associated rhomboid family serine protease